jgi:hypothetical protein
MKTLSHTETTAPLVLPSWSEDLVSRAARAIKPGHRADQVAAEVAERGSPAGA